MKTRNDAYLGLILLLLSTHIYIINASPLNIAKPAPPLAIFAEATKPGFLKPLA